MEQEAAGGILPKRNPKAYYSNGIMLLRVLWGGTFPFFRFSPRTFFGWRRFLLRLFGAKIGKYVRIYNSGTIYMPWNLSIEDYAVIGEHAHIYNLGTISIGAKAIVSQRTHLCAGTHDYTRINFPLLKLPIVIGEQAWVCAGAYIGPNITIGERAFIGARSVVTKDVASWNVVAGNPA